MTSSDSPNKRRRLLEADSDGVEDSRAVPNTHPPAQAWPVTNGTMHPSRPSSAAHASTAMLYPEWGLPEPVAVPHAPELSWLQSSDTQQASDSQPGVSQHQRSGHDHQHPRHSAAEPDIVSPPMHTLSPDDSLSLEQRTSAQQPVLAVEQPVAPPQADLELGSDALLHQASVHHQPQSQDQAFKTLSLNLLHQQPSHQQTVHQQQPHLSAPSQFPPFQQPPLHQLPQPQILQPQQQQQHHQQPSQPFLQQLFQQQQQRQSQMHQPQPQQQPAPLQQHQQSQLQPTQQQQRQPPGQLQTQQPEADASLSAELRQQPGAGPSHAAGVPYTNLGAYSQRELFLQNLEDNGDMSFEYVLNDGQRHNNIWLIALKNIFSKQLPNMPREYIARLVLDRRHRSVAIVRRKRNVVGGITYRPFHKQGFGEIAFCAVTANEQVKGFGTRLMNFTKEYAKTQDHLTHFLTYADNNAVGYFAKQGFTKEITLDKECWVGFIKDYDGGTLMECVIVHRLPHTRLPAMLQAQKQALESCIRHYSKSHVVREGLTDFQNGARHVDIASIPGIKEAGWDPGDSSGTGVRLLMNNSILDATPNNLQHFMMMVVRRMQADENFWCFLEPVAAEDVPDYRDIVKDPVDLSMMQGRLQQKDYYLTLDIFAADMRRIFNNCRLYNPSDSIYYKSANKAESFFDHFMHTHLLFGQT